MHVDEHGIPYVAAHAISTLTNPHARRSYPGKLHSLKAAVGSIEALSFQTHGTTSIFSPLCSSGQFGYSCQCSADDDLCAVASIYLGLAQASTQSGGSLLHPGGTVCRHQVAPPFDVLCLCARLCPSLRQTRWRKRHGLRVYHMQPQRHALQHLLAGPCPIFMPQRACVPQHACAQPSLLHNHGGCRTVL